MKLSLQSRVSIVITLIIISISVISTFLFIFAHSRSTERGLIERGKALSYSLSKAAQEGLINEDLDLIKKASGIVKTSDVSLAQVYSDIWDAVDAFPIGKLKDPPDQKAIAHFKHSEAPIFFKNGSGYDFYDPILFKVAENSTPVLIGYVRLVLSPETIQNELRGIVVTNIAVSAVITLIAIISINILITRLVMRPVMSLYNSVTLFKNGILPKETAVSKQSANEIRELAVEFDRMCRSIKEKENELVESGKRIRSLFERVEHGIFRLDRNGTIVEENGRFSDLFGDVKDLCDILIGEMTAPDCLKNAVSERGFHIEDRAVGKKGEEIIISLTLYPETDSKGEVAGFDGYVIDITEKKRIEERLFRAQKMEAVGTLAGGMAHDFNNLLTAILGYAEIILSMTKEGDQFNKPATIIYDAAKRGADFGKKILAITRKEKMETRPVNINEIVKTSLELLRRSIRKNIEIITILEEDLPYTRADLSQLQQVIINLVINAVDAMPDGGKLNIETSVVGIEEDGAKTLLSDNMGHVRLSVSDTGSGIDSVTQRKIFDPFFTTKELGKGTGLGLYIVHSIINNHGGYINLYSEPNKGTRFNIYLPVTRDTDADRIVSEPNISGSEVILIVDDEADVRELCADMLEPLGYTVLRAENGNAGVNIFREMRGKISLVILDMIMPKMSGSEVFQALRTIDRDVKVLLCSGYSQNGFAGINELLKRGASGFIQKPFSRQNLAVSIRKAISPEKGSPT